MSPDVRDNRKVGRQQTLIAHAARVAQGEEEARRGWRAAWAMGRSRGQHKLFWSHSYRHIWNKKLCAGSGLTDPGVLSLKYIPDTCWL